MLIRMRRRLRRRTLDAASEFNDRRGHHAAPTPWRRRLAGIATVPIIVLGGLSMMAPAANASATGCSYFGTGSFHGYFVYNGSECTVLNGSGQVVYDVESSFSSWGNICNWDITAEFFDAKWHWHKTFVSSHHWGCSHWGADWIPIYEKMQNLVGTKAGYMCSTLRVAGQRLTSVCHYVHP